MVGVRRHARHSSCALERRPDERRKPLVQRRDLDFEIPLTREQWDQLGESANARPDFGVMRWASAERDVIHLSIRADDTPPGWDPVVPRERGDGPSDREVARFVYNDGRPYAQLAPPDGLEPPAVQPADARALDVGLERWVRGKWHELLRDAGIATDRGALPPEEPNAV
jgi:hypothetical protein